MDPHVAHHYLRHLFVIALAWYVVFVVLFAIPLLQLARKAGLHFTLALLPLLGPLGVLIAVYVIAFTAWKPAQA